MLLPIKISYQRSISNCHIVLSYDPQVVTVSGRLKISATNDHLCVNQLYMSHNGDRTWQAMFILNALIDWTSHTWMGRSAPASVIVMCSIQRTIFEAASRYQATAVSDLETCRDVPDFILFLLAAISNATQISVCSNPPNDTASQLLGVGILILGTGWHRAVTTNYHDREVHQH